MHMTRIINRMSTTNHEPSITGGSVRPQAYPYNSVRELETPSMSFMTSRTLKYTAS